MGDGEAPDPVGQVRVRLRADDAWAELRGPAICELLDDHAKRLSVRRIGPDPIRAGADPAPAFERVRASSAPIGVLLMDQRVLGGVGNIYRAEVLFRHGINPYREGSTVTEAELTAIWADLAELMRAGVRRGRIDTVRPEHSPRAMGRDPRRDRHGGEVYVYRRAGRPCLVCGTPVATAELNGRRLYWCPSCQR
jgi:endonuclease-8